MKRYDIKCPVCGTLNKELFLEETNGFMVCEKCGTETQDVSYVKRHSKKVPVLTFEQLVLIYKRSSISI